MYNVYKMDDVLISCGTVALYGPSIGYLLDFTNPYYTALAGNMKAVPRKITNFEIIRNQHGDPQVLLSL
jgi:hypothetical protein